MTVLLSRPYAGVAAGSVGSFTTATEAALVAQGLAVTSSAVPTSGALTQNTNCGRVTIAAGQSSLVVTNNLVDANTKISAVINQAAADGTLLYVARIVPAAGSFTIYGNANATAATVVDWWIPEVFGMTPNN